MRQIELADAIAVQQLGRELFAERKSVLETYDARVVEYVAVIFLRSRMFCSARRFQFPLIGNCLLCLVLTINNSVSC